MNDGIYTVATYTPSALECTFTESLATEATFVATCALATWIDVKSPSISFTMTNSVTYNFYNDDVAVSAHMGRLGIEGSVTVPYSQSVLGVGQSAGDENYMITRFLQGDPLLIAWYWGQSGAADAAFHDNVVDDYLLDPAAALDRYKNDGSATNPKNFISVVANVRVNDYEMAGDNELMTECTLMGVTDGLFDAVQLYAHYDDSKLSRIT